MYAYHAFMCTQCCSRCLLSLTLYFLTLFVFVYNVHNLRIYGKGACIRINGTMTTRNRDIPFPVQCKYIALKKTTNNSRS